jgi:hypothetical protein
MLNLREMCSKANSIPASRWFKEIFEVLGTKYFPSAWQAKYQYVEGWVLDILRGRCGQVCGHSYGDHIMIILGVTLCLDGMLYAILSALISVGTRTDIIICRLHKYIIFLMTHGNSGVARDEEPQHQYLGTSIYAASELGCLQIVVSSPGPCCAR